MARRKDIITAGNCYHIYNRGNQKNKIFFERENYLFFLRNWRKYFDGTLDLFCYCLMPNHYHFLLKPLDDDFSHRMQNFTISYVIAFNKRYNRVGHLFQGNFKAKPVQDNNVLIHLTKYIHLNPVIAGLVSEPQHWAFSSYRDYVKIRNGTLVKPELIFEQFDNYLEYKKFVEAALNIDIISEYIFDKKSDR